MRAGTIVREARAEAGLSQRELARRAGLPQASVSRIERGIVAPRTDTLDRLLRVCEKDVELVTRPGTGVDVTLIRERLKLSPGERARLAEVEWRNTRPFARARPVRSG